MNYWNSKRCWKTEFASETQSGPTMRSFYSINTNSWRPNHRSTFWILATTNGPINKAINGLIRRQSFWKKIRWGSCCRTRLRSSQRWWEKQVSTGKNRLQWQKRWAARVKLIILSKLDTRRCNFNISSQLAKKKSDVGPLVVMPRRPRQQVQYTLTLKRASYVRTRWNTMIWRNMELSQNWSKRACTRRKGKDT